MKATPQKQKNKNFEFVSGQVLPFPYAYGGVPWGMYPGLFQQQQQQQHQNGAQSGSTTPITTNGNARRPGSPGSSGGANTNGTVTPGPPELTNGQVAPASAAAAANGQVPPIQLFPAAYIDPSGAFLRGAAPPHANAGLRLIQPNTQGPLVMNNGLAMAAAAAPQTSLGFSVNGSAGSRRESMDRGSSSAFSPSLLEQYKNKGGWPNYAGGLGNGKLIMAK